MTWLTDAQAVEPDEIAPQRPRNVHAPRPPPTEHTAAEPDPSDARSEELERQLADAPTGYTGVCVPPILMLPIVTGWGVLFVKMSCSFKLS